MLKEPSEKRMSDPATIQLPKKTRSEQYNIYFTDDAAAELHDLSDSTGLSIEALLEVSLRLTRIVAEARSRRRRVVVTTNSLSPIEELTLPKM